MRFYETVYAIIFFVNAFPAYPSTAGRLEQEGGCSEREREGCCVLGGEVCACLYACMYFNLFADLAFKR